MDLFVAVIAILFIQVWGAENPLHRDEWMSHWIRYLQQGKQKMPATLFVMAVGIPVLGIFLFLWIISINSYWPLLPFGVVILLYSFGRGEFGEIVAEYTQACYEENWESAIKRAAGLGVEVDSIAPEDWSALHHHVFDEAVYRGFERMFAILFWFFVLGPVGALLYRLVFLFNDDTGRENANSVKFLWLMEWPVVRALGLSFAITGNFVGCYNRWRESLLCVERSTQVTLSSSVMGALSVNEELDQTCEVTRVELLLLEKLYRRTLWFWLAVAAIITLMG